MNTLKLPSIRLMGIMLEDRTSNENGRSNEDCGQLWQNFQKQDIVSKIPNKISDAVYAVYFDYDSDQNGEFSYFLGCPVGRTNDIPKGLSFLKIPAQSYRKITAKGEMPKCIAKAWESIWRSDIERTYQFDFEVYDQRSKDWKAAEIDIYLGVLT